jgi:hypothetical protein
MRRLRGQLKVLLVAITGVLFIGGLLPATVLAADNRQGQSVTVGPNEVINDDLYVAANTVDIQGTINGNLIAVGGTITVSGLVTRDVNASGANISIPGEIQGSARLAGGQVTVSGKITGDLVVAASTVSLAQEASVGRDVMAAAGTATFAGSITRNVQVAGRDVVFSGPVGGNVTAWDTTLKLESGAAIQGNLDYTSNQDVSIAGGAVVAGSTHRTVPSNGPTIASYLIGWLQTLVGFFLLGALVIFLVPRFNIRAVEAYRMAPWSRLGVGLAVLLVVPVIALMAFVLGLIVGGWWLALFLIGGYMLTLAVGYALVGEMIGRFTLERLGQPNVHALVALLAGLIILLVASSIPWVGWLVGLIALIYGVGMVVIALPSGKPPTPQAAAVVTPPAGLVRASPSAG